MLNDEALSGLIWADVEDAWMEVASPANRPHVQDFISALWKRSVFLPEPLNLQEVMAATLIVAGPPCFPPPSDAEGSMT